LHPAECLVSKLTRRRIINRRGRYDEDRLFGIQEVRAGVPGFVHVKVHGSRIPSRRPLATSPSRSKVAASPTRPARVLDYDLPDSARGARLVLPRANAYITGMRPLVVYSGQGLALADGFDLVRAKLWTQPELMTECFSLVPERQRADLDAVLLACGSAGDRPLDLMMKALRAACFAERRARRELPHHRAIFEPLAREAQRRVVLHITANIDGLTSVVGVEEFGAIWQPRRALTDIARIVSDAKEAVERDAGLLHFPVHGEVGLLADKSREGARLLITIDEDDGVGRYSTVYMGIGRNRVTDVPNTMAFSGFGYDLLSGLVRGAPTVWVEGGVTIPAIEPADFVVFGYGAGSAPEREDYPLESRIPDPSLAGAWKRPDGATWRACCYEPTAGDPTVIWFKRHGFDIVEFKNGELSEAVRRAIGR